MMYGPERRRSAPDKDGLDGLPRAKRDVTAALRGLADVAERRRREDRCASASNADLVRKLEEDRFHLVVVGEFNHGKTHVRERAPRRARAARRASRRRRR